MLALTQTAIVLAMRSHSLRTVVLVRHGAVDRLAAGVPAGALYGGDIDVPLSQRGEAEARAAAAYVTSRWRVSSVWSSPLTRAIYGAQAIADATGVATVGLSEAFREIKRGAWLRKTPDEIETITPGGMAAFLADTAYRPPDAESIDDVRRRALGALESQILPLVQPGDAAVLVSHLYVTRALLSYALPGTPIPDIDVPTASISTLVYADGDDVPAVDIQGIKPDLLPSDSAALLAAADAET